MPRSDYSEAIQVEGLRPFLQELRELDKKLPHQMQVANKRTAEFVVERAGATFRSLGKAGARVVPALTARATQNAASVNLDPKVVPGALGVEFGAYHDRLRSTGRRQVHGWNQFQTWRSKAQGAGYALFPTIRNETEAIKAFYDAEIEGVLHKAFPD